MTEGTNRLDKLYIASPCSAKWEHMQGDERARMCSQCTKHVYNISDMSKNEAEEFLQTHGVSACVRFFRRWDGTIMTEDCPVGLRKLRNGLRLVSQFVASIIVVLISFACMSLKVIDPKKKILQAGIELDAQPDYGSTWDIRKNYFMSFPVAGEPSLSDDQAPMAINGTLKHVIVDRISGPSPKEQNHRTIDLRY